MSATCKNCPELSKCNYSEARLTREHIKMMKNPTVKKTTINSLEKRIVILEELVNNILALAQMPKGK